MNMKKTYYLSKAEIHYRELVQKRKEHMFKSKAENDFKDVYGKWPTALEIEQYQKNKGFREWSRKDK